MSRFLLYRQRICPFQCCSEVSQFNVETCHCLHTPFFTIRGCRNCARPKKPGTSDSTSILLFVIAFTIARERFLEAAQGVGYRYPIVVRMVTAQSLGHAIVQVPEHVR